MKYVKTPTPECENGKLRMRESEKTSHAREKAICEIMLPSVVCHACAASAESVVAGLIRD
jgi:hypothetical protein